MSWSRRRAIGLAAAVAATAAAAAGCGFRPLYRGAEGARVANSLAAIEVLPIDGPLGVEMRNHLRDRLPPPPRGAKARYELSVRVETGASGQITERNTQIRRHLLRLRAHYALLSKADGRTLSAGRATTETSYNIVAGEDYSTLVAERDAARAAARDAGREIAFRLAIWFDRNAEELEAVGGGARRPRAIWFGRNADEREAEE